MVAINFLNPVYLWFLLSIPLLIITHTITFRTSTKKALRFANFEAISRVTGGQLIKKNVFLLVFRILILTMIVLSVSGTTITYIGLTTDSDYVLALDTSASMLAQDINPNRLEAAKETVNSFLDFVPKKTKIGLVSFSGITVIETNLDDDLGKLKNEVNSLDVSPIGGTDLGNAIITSTNILITDKNLKSKVIILITDGQSNIGVPVEEAISYANKNNVIVNTIGIGTEEGGKFIGTDVVSRLDYESLKSIAEKTSGSYFKTTNRDELKDSFQQISKINKKKITFDLAFSFIFLALIFLLAEWALLNTKNKIIP